jgi:hypothetical protein
MVRQPLQLLGKGCFLVDCKEHGYHDFICPILPFSGKR